MTQTMENEEIRTLFQWNNSFCRSHFKLIMTLKRWHGLHLINNGVKVKVKGTQTVLYGCEEVNIAKCPFWNFWLKKIIKNIAVFVWYLWRSAATMCFFPFVFTGTGRDSDKFAIALVWFEAVFVEILVSAAYYHYVLADLAVEIDNCYSKITNVVCFCPA